MRNLYRPRWPLLLTLITGVGALIGLVYVLTEPSGEAVPVQGGTYVEGVAGEPSSVNPLLAAFNEVDRDLSQLVFSGLVRLGPKGEVEPDLAELPTVTPDGLTYIFELRRGLFWHDGEPLDADDVLFTVEMIQDAEFAGDPGLADLFRGVEVEARDEHTVTMTLNEPFAPFLATAATVGILPEHLLGDLGAADLMEAPFNRQPVGSGPFRLVELTQARAVFEPFGAYHFGRPLLERLELRFYRDDSALLNALLQEDIEGALFRPGLTAESIEQIDGDERWVRRSLHTTRASLVYLNPLLEPFADPLVREALQLGLDRETLIADVLSGQALPLDSPIIRDLWAYVGAPEAYAYDPARAGSLLDAAGWQLNDEGVRERDGEPFAFSLAVSDGPVQTGVAEEMTQQWRELGADVSLQVSGGSQFVEGVLLPRRFQAALVSVEPGPDPDPYPLWHSSQALGDGRNLSSFSNPDVDRLLENGRQTTSAAERAEDYRAFQEIFAREHPAVLLYTPTYQYVVRSDLEGLSPGLLVTLSARFGGIESWHVETTESAASDD